MRKRFHTPKDQTSSLPSPAAGMRAVAYVRVSTGRQALHDLSIPDQIEKVEQYCKSQGWSLVEVFSEPGASATDDNRPEFQRMIDSACGGGNPFDIVVVHSLSRFFRDAFQMEFYVRQLAKYRVRLISVTQPVGTSPASVMAAKIWSIFDEYGSLETAKHVERAMVRNSQEGFYNGSPVALGYKVVDVEKRGDKMKKRLAIETGESEIVRLIFRAYRFGIDGSGPIGIKEITKYLNENGYRTRKGARFGVGTVHRILTNEQYAGVGRFNVMNGKSRQIKPADEHVTYETPVIVPRAEFDEVQATLKSRDPRKPDTEPARSRSGPILLTGLACCATCDAPMILRTGTSKTHKVHRYYKCSDCERMGKTACPGQSIPVDKLDKLVTDQIIDRLLKPERLAELLSLYVQKKQADASSMDERLMRFQENLHDAEERLRRLYRLVEDGTAEIDDTLRSRIAELKSDRDSARASIDRMKSSQVGSASLSPEAIVKFGRLMQKNITEGDIPFRKAYLRSLIDRIEVDRNLVRIVGNVNSIEQSMSGQNKDGVRSSVRKWRALRESNPSCKIENLES